MIVLLWWNSNWTRTLYVHRVLRESDTEADRGMPLGVTSAKTRQCGSRTGPTAPQIITQNWERFSHVSRESGAVSTRGAPRISKTLRPLHLARCSAARTASGQRGLCVRLRRIPSRSKLESASPSTLWSEGQVHSWRDGAAAHPTAAPPTGTRLIDSGFSCCYKQNLGE